MEHISDLEGTRISVPLRGSSSFFISFFFVVGRSLGPGILLQLDEMSGIMTESNSGVGWNGVSCMLADLPVSPTPCMEQVIQLFQGLRGIGIARG